MANISKLRRFVELQLDEADAPTVALVLLILDHGHLLRDFEGEPEDYLRRIHNARREALRRVTEDMRS